MSEVCVRVALRIRPLLPKEVLHNHQVCVRAVPGSAQVLLGSDRLFSFDHAFGPTADQDEVYACCVQPLVESLVEGYNATVFCYGQTGSGKTYTLGGGNLEGGIIDCVAEDLFLLLGEKRENGDDVEATVRVSYMELYMEELRDLLELHTIHKELLIRDDEKGNTVVVGAKETVVTSAEELRSVLETGNALRRTGTTGMNDHSSRSHAILTLQLIQCYHGNNSSSSQSVRSSKLCLVDLAGSERAGKTGNTGTRLKESVHINAGLLALGNVIRALSDPGRNRRGNGCNGAHVPYRDAKITRLLRDSLGGSAHTLMVACVSPSHQSVAETLSVLQFASKARHIRNCPRAASTQREVKTCPTTWDPGEARLSELEYELQTLRELLKEKEREMERERTDGRAEEGDSVKEPIQMRMSPQDNTVDQEEPTQYRLLAQEAAVLLADVPNPTSSPSFRQRLQDWQERLTAANRSFQAYEKDCSDRPHHDTISKLREELSQCKENLTIEEQLLEQRDAEMRQVQKQVEVLLQESKTHLQALEEEKERTRIQTEQLVDQRILINHLRSDLVTFRGATSGATVETGASGKRSQSVPLISNSCGHGPPRRIHSSPPAYSLERVMAAFKMRSHLLLAEIEEKEEVYCPFIKQQAEGKDGAQEQEEDEDEDENDIFVGRMGFRRSLNRTWSCRQKKSAEKENDSGLDETCNGNPSHLSQPQQATGTKENLAKQSHTRKARLRASVTQRRIQDLSVNMRMKEELIKELDKTDKETRAADRHGRHREHGSGASVLASLSVQSQQVRSEMYHSLRHMRRQREQLQSSLGQQRESSSSEEPDQNREQKSGVLTVSKRNHQKELKQQLHDCVWLEEEEERVLQKRAELQELEEELRRREEVLVRREGCLQQKSKLEIKMLRSSQALSQDLVRVSLRLESLGEQLHSSSSLRKSGGATMEELEKERDTLAKRRDTLDLRLKDNRVLTEEEEHCLLQLEEAIEALDAALEFKNRSIQEKQRKLLIKDSSLLQPQSSEPAQLCDVIRKLKSLSPPEASELLVKYFNKVVCLREEERRLRLRCEELELQTGEKEALLREMEVSMQRLALDADRRLTQQHHHHQNNIQLLLQKLKDGGSEESQQPIKDRLQHLEKELFFYKSSSRQLKKKLKEIIGDSLHPVALPSHTLEHGHLRGVQSNQSAKEPRTYSDEAHGRTQVGTTHTKMHAEHNPHLKKHAHQTSSSSDLQARKTTKMLQYDQVHTQSLGRRGHSGDILEMTPGRLSRRELRQISSADLHVCSSATRGRQSVVETSTDSMLEDSIEVPRNTDR
uniref:kinesin-like protein KIF27 isoform X2 n=1 Tax=Gasterosteus aculeatus aculeatus TaxID=481459 RepID=UPI001A995AD0|nr:kinesin-like protein KIF27 isoform X2 [Gasterosteus aculeatus aculeatus]